MNSNINFSAYRTWLALFRRGPGIVNAPRGVCRRARYETIGGDLKKPETKKIIMKIIWENACLISTGTTAVCCKLCDRLLGGRDVRICDILFVFTRKKKKFY